MSQMWMKILPRFIRTRLEARPKLREIASNTGWLLADRILRLGVGLFVGVWVARYLGPEQFGLYNYALAFAGLFGAFAALGLDSIVVRDIVSNPTNKDEVLGTAFALKLIGGGGSWLMALGAIFIMRPGDRLAHSIVGIAAAGLIIQAFDTIDLWFQSQVQSKNTVYAKNAAFLLTALVRAALVWVRAPLIAFAYAGLAEVGLGAVGLVIVYLVNGHWFALWRVSLSCAKRLLKASWPLIISSMAIVTYMKIDQIMLSEMVSDQAVGVYAAAIRISELWYFIPTALVLSVFPSIIEVKKISEAAYYHRLQKLFDVMAGLALVIAVPMTLLSDVVIRLLYSAQYAGAGPILAIHIWAALFVFLGVAQSPWDISEGLTRLALLRTLLGAVINVAMNFVLLPLYAGLGAAISTVVAYAVSACLANALDARTRPILILQIKSLFLVRYLRWPTRAS
jgi:PST family polysaccharide transporter